LRETREVAFIAVHQFAPLPLAETGERRGRGPPGTILVIDQEMEKRVDGARISEFAQGLSGRAANPVTSSAAGSQRADQSFDGARITLVPEGLRRVRAHATGSKRSAGRTVHLRDQNVGGARRSDLAECLGGRQAVVMFNGSLRFLVHGASQGLNSANIAQFSQCGGDRTPDS
jgi:hypothetical protein